MKRDDLRRRRVLQITAGLATAALAGCADTGDGGNNATGNGTTTGPMGTTAGTTDGGMETTEGTTEQTAEGTTEEQTTTTGGSGRLRVVHASPDAPAVDVYVDGDAVLTGVSFGTVSDYLTAPAGERAVRITAAGDESTVAFDGMVTVQADTSYTAIAFGNLTTDEFAVGVLEDAPPSVGSDEAAVNLFHASPDAPPVTVTVASSGDALFEGLEYGEQAGYVTVPAGSYTLEVRPASGGDPVATFDVSVEGGTAYSAFAVGYLDPGNAPGDEPFDLLLATDTTTTMQLL